MLSTGVPNQLALISSAVGLLDGFCLVRDHSHPEMAECPRLGIELVG